jgi:hypothetical protein
LPGTPPAARRFAVMEYEIRDEGEEGLMDTSTNPSLDHRDDKPAKAKPATGPNAAPADKRKLQRGELIPEEEEHQLA